MTSNEHLKAVADQIAQDLAREYGTIAPHIIGIGDKTPSKALQSLMLTVAESLKEQFDF